MADETGTKHDVIKLSRHVLNRAASNRTVSKQECMALLSGLDLVKCSETIETVSMSGQCRVQQGDKGTMHRRCENRDESLRHLSLDGFFHHVKNGNRSANHQIVVPHYVGGNSIPVYPANEEYAKTSLTIYKPWAKGSPPCDDATPVVDQFLLFLKDPDCPPGLRIPYERARHRHNEKRQHTEPTSSEVNVSDTHGLDQDIIELLQIVSTFNSAAADELPGQHKFERGVNYEWDKDRIDRVADNGESWLLDQVDNERSTTDIPSGKKHT